jgi:hypothetical protein
MKFNDAVSAAAVTTAPNVTGETISGASNNGFWPQAVVADLRAPVAVSPPTSHHHHHHHDRRFSSSCLFRFKKLN